MSHHLSSPPVRCLCLGLALGWTLAAQAEPDHRVVERWLATNSRVATLKVEFTQTRRLAGLKNPIRRYGLLWLDHQGKRFRWQLGDPPHTIVTRDGSNLLIVRPSERRFERRPAGEEGAGGLAVLARGFPRSPEEFRRKYRLLHVNPLKDSTRIVTQPLDRSATGVRTFTFVVGTDDARLRGIDLLLRDGSTQQIQFTKITTKPSLPAKIFQPDVSGYQATKF